MKYILLSLLLLSGCSSVSYNASDNTVLIVKSENDEKPNETMTLYLSKTEITGEEFPDDLSKDLSYSLIWKWNHTDKLPNICYFIEYDEYMGEPPDYDFGLAMLDLSSNGVSGILLRYPDAGLEIDFTIGDNGVVTGFSEFWGGPFLINEDDGSIIEKEPNITTFEGVAKNYGSIQSCVELIKSKVSEMGPR